MNDAPPENNPERLSQLTATRPQHAHTRPGYSKFIKSMKIILPLIALCIVAVIFSWNIMNEEKIMTTVADIESKPSIGKNELTNPRFDSVDEKNQPYTITASRALQSNADEDIVILDEPLADILLNSGHWLALKAEQGAFRQQSQRLLLKEKVMLFHDDGYILQTPELDVDMENNKAWTALKVEGNGPRGTLNAENGMDADAIAETLIFKGPAKLVLFDTGKTNALNMEMPSP